MKIDTDIILQARLGSSRLPKKVLANLNEKSMLHFLVERIKRCNLINKIFLATTNNAEDDYLAEQGELLKLVVVRGSERDVLSRFYKVSKISQARKFIRITADCPFIDHFLIEDLIKAYDKQKVDYLSNCYPPSLPDGLDLEIFSRESLNISHKECADLDQREHVTQWIRESGKFKLGCLSYTNNSNLRLTVDEPEDLDLIRTILKQFNCNDKTPWFRIIEILNKNPKLVNINSNFKRNEGSKMSNSQKMWKRAKKIIPGGNMLLSKRPEMFLPEKWPTYFTKAKGCQVWDLDDKKYIDMALMGVGTNILGFCHPKIDEAVSNTISKGNLSSLNCPEEVLLAEKLIELHPWADMAKFARTGGEANAISIRIARAATGRDVVAICGYHGWHDWYMATNLEGEEGLKEHLLSGLEPNGVPKGLAGTVKPFSFNNLPQLEKIARENKLAAIKMEVERSTPPKKEFLEGIKKICSKEKIVLIFDECTSGFRETYGGIHKKYSIEPDMAIFGKALGNGYAITSIIGKQSVMEAAQNSFISSTFWTERIGPTAALKTLEVMKEIRSWELITKKGKILKNLWKDLAKSNNLDIKLQGMDALSGFYFNSENNLKYKTLISQEMLKVGFLATNTCYLSISHTSDIFEKYAEKLDYVFQLISRCEQGESVDNYLNSEICHSGFERLN